MTGDVTLQSSPGSCIHFRSATEYHQVSGLCHVTSASLNGFLTPPVCTDKRQRVALELLESERVYVSHLSLLLKANISFNGSEAFASKDKRWALKINTVWTQRGNTTRISQGNNWFENSFGVISDVCKNKDLFFNNVYVSEGSYNLIYKRSTLWLY